MMTYRAVIVAAVFFALGCHRTGVPAGADDGADAASASDSAGGEGDDTGSPDDAGVSYDLECSADDWQLLHPPLGRYDFGDVRVFGRDDVFASAASGRIARFDGETWWAEETVVGEGICYNTPRLWGSGADNVFMVTDCGAVMHFDGDAWERVDFGAEITANGIWGSGPDDVYVVGNEATLFHFDGAAWTEEEIDPDALPWEDLYDIWGSGPDNLYAVGDPGIYHFDGTAWRRTEVQKALMALWGNSPDDVWAVGNSCRVYHFDGTAWTARDSHCDGLDSFVDVWGSGPSDIWVVGDRDGAAVHFDGHSWERVDTVAKGRLLSIWGDGPKNVYAGGEGGPLLHFDGEEWTDLNGAVHEHLESVWVSDDPEPEIFAVGWDGALLRGRGTDFHRMHPPSVESFYAVWGSAPDDVFAVSANGSIIHYDGDHWSSMIHGAGEEYWLHSVWGSGKDDVYAAGASRRVLHYDGDRWSVMDMGMTFLNDVWALPDGRAYAVGRYGVVWRYDGLTWSELRPLGSGETLHGVWAAADDDVYAVGEGATILHYNGEQWVTMETDLEADYPPKLGAVWGNGPDDVWVGGRRVLLRLDGGTWRVVDKDFNMDPDGVTDIRSLWGPRPDKVFAAGYSCDPSGEGEGPNVCETMISVYEDGKKTVLYRDAKIQDGEQWTGVADIWGFGDDDLVAVGCTRRNEGEHRALVMRYEGDEWRPIEGPDDRALTSVWGRAPGDLHVSAHALSYDNDSSVVHFDGADWTAKKEGISDHLMQLHGASNDVVFAVGRYGTILQYDDLQWSERIEGAVCDEIRDLWGDPDRLFAVCREGAVLQYDGAGWTRLFEDTSLWLEAVWGSDSSNLFAVGQSGNIVRFDGVQWTTMSGPVDGFISDVWGTGPNDVFAVVGAPNAILHWNGLSWEEKSTGFKTSLEGIAGTGPDNIFVVGSRATLLRHTCQ